MLYRENGQFKTSYAADQQIFAVTQDRIAIWLLLAVSAALLAVTAFGIMGLASFWVQQRTRQIGILKATGASNAYIARDSVGQMTVLVAIATVIGVSIGLVAITVLSRGDAPVELDARSVAVVAGSLVAAGIVGSLAALRRIASTEPRVYPLGRFNDKLQAAYVARSRVLNFPDLVQVAAVPDGQGSWPVIYSRSVYGRYDFGVNRQRVETWLSRIPDAIRAETE